MNDLIFEQILLDCFQQIEAERSSSNVYYLLKGKRSIQTIQDAHIYQLNNYYGIYKNLTKEHFEIKIKELVKVNFLIQHDGQASTYALTNQGIEWLHSNPNHLYFNGLTYFEKADVFIERLLLLIQTLTNSKMDHFSFIPVIHNQEVEQWMKKVYRKVKRSETAVLQRIYDELSNILTLFTEKEAEIFVSRLSGYNIYGLSIFQLEIEHGLPKEDVSLILQSMTHKMMHQIEKDETRYPTLASLIDRKTDVTFLTQSAKQTYYYYVKNYTVTEIAKIRKLKENTIYDHFVEIALYDDTFPIRDYVTIQEENEIMDAITKANSHRLKDIKGLVGEEINYFQIRLVIALRNKGK